jgi:glycosyltransferase involved in cell wall biosynthesis
MAGEVRRSSLLGGRPVSIIPNGTDTAEFRHVDSGCARVALGIPENARVVLFAGPLGSKWKGFNDLSTALTTESSLADVVVVSVGHGAQVPALGGRHIHLGYVDSDRVLAAVYSAADLLAFPSLHDNLPNTVIESMACGTPVVAYDVGGVPDLVRPGVTGLLVPLGDVRALGAAIAQLLADETRRSEMSKNCRSVAVEEYSLDIQARRYVELYERILDGEGG